MEPVHPDDREKWMEAWDRYITGNAPIFEVEHRALTESGDWAWMLQRGQVVARDEHGQPLRIAGMYQDVSARVRAEEVLQRRAAQLATLNRIENRISSILDREDLLQCVVDAVRDDLGYPRAAVLLVDVDEPQVPTRLRQSPAKSSVEPLDDEGASELTVATATDEFWELIPDNYRQPVGKGAIGMAAETGETILVRDASSDPRVYQVGTWLSPSSLSAPIEVAGRVIGVLEVEADVPDAFDENDILVMDTLASQVAVAIENARLYEALRESEQTLKLAMEGANVGFWYQNLATDAGTTIIQEILVRGQVVVRDDFGKPLRIAGIHQDVTERVRAQEELREARAAAEKARRAAEDANRAKSVFLANMSHELRTPLNAILGFSQLMLRESVTGDSGLSAEQRENLEIIGRSGEHLLGLINDVLELSKIEVGRVALHKECFDLRRLLGGLEEMFHLRAADKGLMLIFDRAPDVPQYVRADEGKLRQVLMNLLGNAVKFTAEGGVTLRVGCLDLPGTSTLEDSFREGNPRLLFEVEDTGPGIAPEELDAVFDPFKQTASGQKSHEGTGLGMPISRQFVRLMGGDLTFRSELGVGSLFRFDVQVQLADAADVPTAQPTRRVVGLEPDQPVYRLLVVEDREANRRLLVRLLAPLGFEMREATNGQEGIEVWQRWKPHLIWMDLRMPVMDGHEATQRIKCTTQGQATVVIALTASAFEEDRVMILSEGCDDYVRKPFREQEIFDALTKHLGVRFVYAEDAQPVGVPTESAAGVLTAAALGALPADWVTSLHGAASQLDADLILAMLDQVRDQHAPLCDALEGLVHDFRFDTILALTQ
jgi:signal transduction histidine kinase/ActR/RegA family two-component response regulator